MYTSELQTNFSLNQTAEALNSYCLWAKCQIIEKMKGTCEINCKLPWPETKFNRTIGKEENRRIKLD